METEGSQRREESILFPHPPSPVSRMREQDSERGSAGPRSHSELVGPTTPRTPGPQDPGRGGEWNGDSAPLEGSGPGQRAWPLTLRPLDTDTRLTSSASFSKEDKIHICKEYHLVIQSSRKPSVGQIKKALMKMYGLGFWGACGGHSPESGWEGV